MLSKLFSMYPPRPDAEMSLAAYLDELSDLPPLLISHALHRLVRKRGEFVPGVAAIRAEAAHVLRETHRRAAGLEPYAGLPEYGIAVESWLKKAQEPLPASRQLSAGSSEERATVEQRAKGAALLEAKLGPIERKMGVRR